jgi:hypothetical protein
MPARVGEDLFRLNRREKRAVKIRRRGLRHGRQVQGPDDRDGDAGEANRDLGHRRNLWRKGSSPANGAVGEDQAQE